jgi:hypothetical protein
MSKYAEVVSINGQKIDKKYVASLDKQGRENLVEPLFNHFRNQGWLYPDEEGKIKSEYQKLVDHVPDLSSDVLFNNSSLATNICKFFCHKFYHATEKGKRNMIEVFNDDQSLKKLIRNRLGMDWYDPANNPQGVEETFHISFRMMVQGLRSSRLVPSISVFKPDVAKYMYTKYSQPEDTVFDYSAGWGARMLGAASCNRKYIGVDPWTIDELETMKNYLDLKEVTLIQDGSENVSLGENTIDFSFSSPPYVTDKSFIKEFYCQDDNQAYSQGIDSFYNNYWKNTLLNVKAMLKPGKWFGLNVTRDCSKMVEMAKAVFGEPVEEVSLRLVKSHLNKKGKEDATKYEPIFMFKNIK